MTTSIPKVLRHIHLPGVVPYATAARLQERLVARFLASKPPSNAPAPPPYIMTAQFRPVYTCGRREVGTLSLSQQDFLRANGRAEFVEALRGGQTTFHGPGQLVAYPIIDLRTHKLTPRSYVCLLEKSLISTCAKYGIEAMTTEHTGVWTSPDDKIAAIGVHMRRNITSHGVGLNVNTDLWWFDRIVACGLPGKKTTNFIKHGIENTTLDDVGNKLVREIGERLHGVEYIDAADDDEVKDLLTA